MRKKLYWILQEGGDDLDQRDGGGDGGDENQQIEDDAEQGAYAAHIGEHVLQGDEQELGSAEGDLVVGKAGGHAVPSAAAYRVAHDERQTGAWADGAHDADGGQRQPGGECHVDSNLMSRAASLAGS